MDINHISVSRKQVFDLCQQQYKFQYHLKAPKDKEEPFYFIYGKIVHKIAEIYVKAKGDLTLNQASKQVLQGEVEIEPEKFAPKLPSDYLKRFPKHIQAIQSLTKKIGLDGLTEQEFYYDLDPPNEKFVKGVIDRIIQRGDKFFIIDYKTTQERSQKNEYTILHDLQLKCYAKVIQKKYNAKAENIQTALYYLENEKLLPVKFSQKSIDESWKALLDVYNQIKAANPDKVRGNVGYHCRNCSYAKQCPFYSIT